MTRFAMLTVISSRAGKTQQATLERSIELDAPPALKGQVLNMFRAHAPQLVADHDIAELEQQSNSAIAPLIFLELHCTEFSTSLLLQWITETGQGWTLTGPPNISVNWFQGEARFESEFIEQLTTFVFSEQ
jgi:hypothetical protein